MNLFPARRRRRGLSGIAGPVLRPADPGYAAELAPFHTPRRLRPGLVVGAAHEADVVATIDVAAADGLPVAVRGTGHGASPDVAAPVLITTRRLDAVQVDPRTRTARVGAGATWAHVLAAAAPHGLAPLPASSTTVGVAGYTLGGGMSPLGRRFGFATDHLRRLRLVTADRCVHDIDADRAPELFWALRGAGTHGFGVVTELEFALLPLTRLHGGGLLLPGAAAADLLHAWREWAPTLPEEAGTSIALLRPPHTAAVSTALPAAQRGRPVVHLRWTHTGDPAAAEALLAPLRAIAPPLVDDVRTRPVTDLDAVHRDPDTRTAVHEHGAALRALPAEAVDALLAAAGPHLPDPPGSVELRQMGGALARPAPVPDVVAGRAAACVLSVRSPRTAPPADPSGDPTADPTAAAVSRVVAAVAPWTLGGPLPNFGGSGAPGAHPSDADAADALWPLRDRVRLHVLRRAVDPDGMFADLP